MATKAEERTALNKIVKIIEGLGEESYIGHAFEGCVTIARDNIDNDWWDSMKQRYEAAKNEAAANMKGWDECAESKTELEGEVGKLSAEVERVRNLGYEDDRRRREERDRADAAEARVNEAEAKVAEQAEEILKLKAMLFDLMYNK